MTHSSRGDSPTTEGLKSAPLISTQAQNPASNLPNPPVTSGGSSQPPPLPIGPQPVASGLDSSNEASELSAEEIRMSHIKRESLVRTLGWIVFTLGVLIGCVALAITTVAVLGLVAGQENAPSTEIWFGVIFVVGLALAFGTFSYGLVNLQAWCRWIALFGSLTSLYFMQAGGRAVALLFIWQLLTNKTATVFSRQYREIVDQTPHIRYQLGKGVVVEQQLKRASASSSKR
jgi:hypothetical protein